MVGLISPIDDNQPAVQLILPASVGQQFEDLKAARPQSRGQWFKSSLLHHSPGIAENRSKSARGRTHFDLWRIQRMARHDPEQMRQTGTTRSSQNFSAYRAMRGPQRVCAER